MDKLQVSTDRPEDSADTKLNKVLAAKTKQGGYVFIAPIANLILTNAVDREFSIDRVTFVDAKKLPRIWKRLGIFSSYSEVRKTKPTQMYDLLDQHKTFAVLFQKHSWNELLIPSFMTIRDELALLSLSQLGYAKRRTSSYVALAGEHENTHVSYAVFSRNDPFKGRGMMLTRGPRELVLSERWANFQRAGFYSKLLQILKGKSNLKGAWPRDLRRAAILVGRSISSYDVPTSFLWNMIALELLLTREGDKYSDVLPKRAEAFLGWVGFWGSENYEARIREVYKKRVTTQAVSCGMVGLPLKTLVRTARTLCPCLRMVEM